MFGGSNYDTQFGDLQAFNTLTCVWKPVVTAISPSPRNPLVFADINGEAILLYGGINLENGLVLNDAFLFSNGEWTSIDRIINAPCNLIGAKFAVCESNPYLFGGELEDEHGIIRPNLSIFRLDVRMEDKILEFV
jgi:hypothetical protein